MAFHQVAVVFNQLVDGRVHHGIEGGQLLGVTKDELAQGAPALDKAAELARLYGVTIDDLVSDEVDVVSTGRGARTRDLHVLRVFVGRTVRIACAGDDGLLEGAEVLDISGGWMRVSCIRKRPRLGSLKVERERVVRLIDIRDIEGIAAETEA